MSDPGDHRPTFDYAIDPGTPGRRRGLAGCSLSIGAVGTLYALLPQASGRPHSSNPVALILGTVAMVLAVASHQPQRRPRATSSLAFILSMIVILIGLFP